MDQTTDKSFKTEMGISLWFAFCVFISSWFLMRFIRGRRQLHYNLRLIEQGLKKMQEDLDRKEAEQKQIGDKKKSSELDNVSLIVVMWRDITYQSFPNFVTSQRKMRNQQVHVDVLKMIISSCSYLGLAFAAWVLIKLIHACFWLPNYLKKEENESKLNPTDDVSSADTELSTREQKTDEALGEQDKKND